MVMKIKETSMLFEERVGVCNVTLCLDKRNPDRAVDGQFPLCMRFTINYKKYHDDDAHHISSASNGRK